MKTIQWFIPWLAAMCLLTGCKSTPEEQVAKAEWLNGWRKENRVWRGVHVMLGSDRLAAELIEALPKLSDQGVNTIIVEVNYAFQYSSHPELRTPNCVTALQARTLATKAKELGIRLIPQFNCFGHQSWAKTTFPLLTKYPQFDETPGQYPENKDIYCRSYCPQHPEVNRIVFALIDELIESFSADAFHVGMDEVFLIASEHCERCRGGDPGKLFAKAINDLHQHLVKERKVEMLMWGDRLLDARTLGYSEWEAAKNGTHTALGMIPTDIIICDWHYGKQETYPSIPFLLRNGFRVWPSGWQPLEATMAFSEYASRRQHPRLLGYLCTTWGKVTPLQAAEWPPITEPLKKWN